MSSTPPLPKKMSLARLRVARMCVSVGPGALRLDANCLANQSAGERDRRGHSGRRRRQTDG